jgi:sulfite exporter TauE/SafE
MGELTFLTALLAGLFGSSHCLAMCGGLATALGTIPNRRFPRQALLYQGGRLVSYATAGAMAGALGAAAGFALAVSSWSALLRLGTALMVIIIGLDISLGAAAATHWLRAPERWGGWLWRRLALARRLPLPSAPHTRALLLGLLWGWLPCGLVYSVLLAAALTGSAAAGAFTMLGFGLGTLPAMSALTYAGAWLPRRDGLAARVLGALLVACGVWTAAVPVALLGGAPQHQHHSGQATPAGSRPELPPRGTPDAPAGAVAD